MQKKWTRRLAALLTACMLVSLFPASALAADQEEGQTVLEAVGTAAEPEQDDGPGDSAGQPDGTSIPAEENETGAEEPSVPEGNGEENPEDAPTTGDEPASDEPGESAGDEEFEEEPEEDAFFDLAANDVQPRETESGWYQDEATVKGSGAVCEDVDGGVHLKAGSENGNSHTTDESNNPWPAIFLNDELSAKLYEGVAADATKFVELTFSSTAGETETRFGVYINYTDPGRGFIVGYDGNGGWYWEEYGGTGGTWYQGARVHGPAAGSETTLRIEWKNNALTSATANGEDLFPDMPRDFSTTADNSGTKLGIKCGTYGSQITEVTISSIDAGVIAETPADPPEPEYDGECGAVENTVFYKLNGTELHIWGSGAMKDWQSTTNMPWNSRDLTSIVIDEGVTTVGLNAFKMGNVSNLQSVSLPEGLTKIGNSAFYHCYGLKEITIPSTVTSIGRSAFEKCSGLGNVILPAGLTELSTSAFSGCEGFTDITIPEGLTKIGDSAFSGCRNVTAVNWGNVEEIGKNAFSGCAFTSVVLPETVTILNDGAFGSCDSLTSIVIPDDVALRNKVFSNSYALQNVVLLGEPHLTYTDKVGYGESSNSVFCEVYNTNPLFIYVSGDAWMAKLAEMSTLGVNT